MDVDERNMVMCCIFLRHGFNYLSVECLASIPAILTSSNHLSLLLSLSFDVHMNVVDLGCLGPKGLCGLPGPCGKKGEKGLSQPGLSGPRGCKG